MKLCAVLFTLIFGSFAHAAIFECPDGTRVIRNSTDTSIVVTVDGKQLTCNLTASKQWPDRCSKSSIEPQCNGTPAHSDCNTPQYRYGKCIFDLWSGRLGADGNPICTCGGTGE